MGICNGFQILTEAHLLPGALIRNIGLKFVCRYVDLRVENAGTPFTQTAEPGDVLRVVVKHNEGNYRVDPDTLARMRDNGQIVLRYCAPDGTEAGEAASGTIGGSSPNGSLDDIAGVCNAGLQRVRPHAAPRELGRSRPGRRHRRPRLLPVDHRQRARPGGGRDERHRAAPPRSRPPSSSASRPTNTPTSARIQGGEPTYVELAIYSLMWSEHCSYKHSRPVLGASPRAARASCRARARTPASSTWATAGPWP